MFFVSRLDFQEGICKFVQTKTKMCLNIHFDYAFTYLHSLWVMVEVAVILKEQNDFSIALKICVTVFKAVVFNFGSDVIVLWTLEKNFQETKPIVCCDSRPQLCIAFSWIRKKILENVAIIGRRNGEKNGEYTWRGKFLTKIGGQM